MPDTEPCRCWITSPAIPHTGHCCFGYPDPDGELYQRGNLPPCQHWHPDVPKPPKLTDPQAHAWATHHCIDCLTKPTRAAGYRCNECHERRMV